MSQAKDRTCVDCGKVERTASSSAVCLLCYKARVRAECITNEEKLLVKLGYSEIGGPIANEHGQRRWTFTHLCGMEQTWTFGNILKRIKADGMNAPCRVCGGKRRMAKAMEAYVAKYGITSEQLVLFERYSKRVRQLSDKTYKAHINEINPHGLNRGMHTHHLDHIVSIAEGYKTGLSPEFMARRENLQMLPALDNLSKGRHLT